MITKNGYDWTGRYIQLAGEAEAIEAKDFIIDGEAISINEAGLSDFHALQSAVTSRNPSRDLYLVAFDLLHLNGHDLRDMPVEDRRDILQALIPTGGRIQFSEAMPGTGDAVYHLVDKAGLEGMVSKRDDSTYRSGPTMNLRKIKCYAEKEMVSAAPSKGGIPTDRQVASLVISESPFLSQGPIATQFAESMVPIP